MKILNLKGKWDIISADGIYHLWGNVPGSLFYALEEKGYFGEEGLFFRENNKIALEIADRDFIWSREFSVDMSQLENENIYLEAEGLDTITEIFLNDHKIAATDNMHRIWRFNVSENLIPGKNSLKILFKNSLEYIRNEKKRRNLYGADNQGITSVEGFNMIRKSHCSYGWDWGPKVPDLGIWRDIKIKAYDTARLHSVHISQIHKDSKVILQLSPEIESFGDGNLTIKTVLTSPDGKTCDFTVPLSGTTEYEVENPRLWWPNGLGDQPLYQLEFFLEDHHVVIDDLSMRIGLRTLTVEQKKDDWGETFNFNCNGISLFARGGNYIPEDVFLNRNDIYKTEQLIQDCRTANFNCIRVWGGGVYPSDHFFDLCDENGLIIWHDLMFACALYDVRNDSFMQNVTEELKDNLTRIRHHASIGLICGNNEMEWAVISWFKATNEEKAEYLKQYQFIFPQIISEICPELFYWPASPSSGGNFENPNDPDRGDCHYWDVWHGNKDFSQFKKHYFRFMSEFGFESFPSIKTIRSFTVEEDLNIFSPVMEEHQKCIGGNGKILTYISKYFPYPKDLDSLVFVSQISQAEAITTGIKHWRRNRGRCMGSTYWQINDNWPVASWSSIDYYGRWKALHYGAKRAYDNILLSIDGDETSAAIHVSNESRECTSGNLEWKLYDLKGQLIKRGENRVSVAPFSSELIEKRTFTEILKNGGERNLYLSVIYRDKNGSEFKDYHNFTPYKYMNLQDPQLEVEITRKDREFWIAVKAEYPAFYVEIDFTEIDAVLSDNFFYLDGGETKIVTMRKGEWKVQKLLDQIRVRSLVNTY
ncbi:MAG: glycoside hydrolase family 2 protein [Spirochaetaceae bacterium]|nr:glycoside hydrolase family 2 protein [Spirochaetaceae bacterium]